LVGCLLSSSLVRAQGSWDAVNVLVPGTVVRVYTAGQVIAGYLVAVEDAQITVSTHNRVLPIQRQAIQRIDQRTSPGNAGKRTLIGAGIGIGWAGIASGLAQAQDGAVTARQVAVAALVSGAIGALVGRAGGRPTEYRIVYRNPSLVP
jgi:hypothetical protein